MKKVCHFCGNKNFKETKVERMELTLNVEKTKIVDGKEEPFDFLGFTVRYDRDLYGRDRKYWNIIPSKKSCKKLRGNIRNCLKSNGHANPTKISKELNWKLRGWINYFKIPGVSYPSKAFRDTMYYLMNRLNRYYYREAAGFIAVKPLMC